MGRCCSGFSGLFQSCAWSQENSIDRAHVSVSACRLQPRQHEIFFEIKPIIDIGSWVCDLEKAYTSYRKGPENAGHTGACHINGSGSASKRNVIESFTTQPRRDLSAAGCRHTTIYADRHTDRDRHRQTDTQTHALSLSHTHWHTVTQVQ